ncbi:MAG: YdiU family protein [Alphaproteobacteria bacterium]|nr:YdiU family protein [Alphaproteobacteria bacterium]
MLQFDNSYVRDLDGMYVAWNSARAPDPKLVVFNEPLAKALGLDPPSLTSREGVDILAGNAVAPGSQPIAQAYAGHQFGSFSPQLGDGRALLLGEILDEAGSRFDIQLKGSGPTPFSRNGDGRAALGPMLREHLMCEAMHALGIPTTRSLAVVTTGEDVYRERALPGAVLTRVAASHIRVGTFQFFAARRDIEKVKRLADYSIARHFPHLAGGDSAYLAFFEAVADRQAQLVARWVLSGFVHGVMNTDNMTISGETIDYGPCAFIDTYDANAVFSSIDVGGRYAYGQQPLIAQFNLTRFAECLVPLVSPDAKDAARQLTEVISDFPALYQSYWLSGMRDKLGLVEHDEEADLDLANALHAIMDGQAVDYTMLFRRMSDVVRGDENAVRSLFASPEAPGNWIERYKRRQTAETVPAEARASAMDRVNPIYIARNHLVEAALTAAVEAGDLSPYHKLQDVLSRPYEESGELAEYAAGPPEGFGPFRTFCGT